MRHGSKSAPGEMSWLNQEDLDPSPSYSIYFPPNLSCSSEFFTETLRQRDRQRQRQGEVKRDGGGGGVQDKQNESRVTSHYSGSMRLGPEILFLLFSFRVWQSVLEKKNSLIIAVLL